MININENILEKTIEKNRVFYINYLLQHKQKRLPLLTELNAILNSFQKFQGRGNLLMDKEYYAANIEAEEYLKKYWGETLLKLFNKEVPFNKSSVRPINDDGFWSFFFTSIAATFEEEKLKNKAHTAYKINFLNFLRDCLTNQGLHPFIHQRDVRIFKRFNFIVTFKENRKEFFISRALLSQNELESEYLAPFYKNKPVFLHGKIIKASSISKINITTTLLWSEDELELFAQMKGFSWDKNKKEENPFSKHCLDETNLYLKNPNAEQPKKAFKNGSLTFVNQSRIEELASIKSKWDLSRLILLCNDLNKSSTEGIAIGVASLTRSIVNFIPPIFGFENFGQIVANYKKGKSVNKNFANLYNSMKNISDHNMHVQASKSDSLPNMTQVDFSNDLDVLLSEICKVLKEK